MRKVPPKGYNKKEAKSELEKFVFFLNVGKFVAPVKNFLSVSIVPPAKIFVIKSPE